MKKIITIIAAMLLSSTAFAVQLGGSGIENGEATTAARPTLTTFTHYVNNTSGADHPGCGTATGASACDTIQYAINKLPRDLGGNTYVVQLADEAITITTTIRIVGFANGGITVQGQSGSRPTAGHYNLDGTTADQPIFYVGNNSAIIIFQGIELENNEDLGVGVQSIYTQGVELYYMVFNNGGIGYQPMRGGYHFVYQCDFSSTKRGIWSTYTDVRISDAVSSTTCDSYGVDTIGGAIYQDGTQPTGATSDENASFGGQFLATP